MHHVAMAFITLEAWVYRAVIFDESHSHRYTRYDAMTQDCGRNRVLYVYQPPRGRAGPTTLSRLSVGRRNRIL